MKVKPYILGGEKLTAPISVGIRECTAARQLLESHIKKLFGDSCDVL
jgi:hypothetical protein